MIVAETTIHRRPAQPAAGPVLRNIGGTAQFFDVAEKTVKDWIIKGCPVEQQGGHGRSYVLDLRKVSEWRAEQKNAAEAKAAADAAAEEALRLELLGDDSLTQQHAPNDARKAAEWVRAEREATRLAEEKGQLVRVEVVAKTVREANSVLRNTVLSVPDQLQHLHGLDDVVVDSLHDLLTRALDGAASEIRALDIAV